MVTDRRYLGAVWRYRVRLGDGTEIDADATADPGDTPLAIDDGCTVTVTATHELHRLST